jgi:hypothetical protein
MTPPEEPPPPICPECGEWTFQCTCNYTCTFCGPRRVCTCDPDYFCVSCDCERPCECDRELEDEKIPRLPFGK